MSSRRPASSTTSATVSTSKSATPISGGLSRSALESAQKESGSLYIVNVSSRDLASLQGTGGLESFRGLRSLTASFSSLKGTGGLRAFPELRELRLSNNAIASLEELEHCRWLEQLQLQSNALSRLDPFSFSGCSTRLRQLRLDNNALDSSELLGVLDACVKLQELDLSGNRLTSLGASLRSLRCLTSLRVACNQLECIAPGELSACATSLLELHAEGNQLVHVAGLASLNALQILRLDDNALSSLETLPPLPSLTDLSLGRNRIRMLQPLATFSASWSSSFASSSFATASISTQQRTILPRHALSIWCRVFPNLELLDVSFNRLGEGCEDSAVALGSAGGASATAAHSASSRGVPLGYKKTSNVTTLPPSNKANAVGEAASGRGDGSIPVLSATQSLSPLLGLPLAELTIVGNPFCVADYATSGKKIGAVSGLVPSSNATAGGSGTKRAFPAAAPAAASSSALNPTATMMFPPSPNVLWFSGQSHPIPSSPLIAEMLALFPRLSLLDGHVVRDDEESAISPELHGTSETMDAHNSSISGSHATAADEPTWKMHRASSHYTEDPLEDADDVSLVTSRGSSLLLGDMKGERRLASGRNSTSLESSGGLQEGPSSSSKASTASLQPFLSPADIREEAQRLRNLVQSMKAGLIDGVDAMSQKLAPASMPLQGRSFRASALDTALSSSSAAAAAVADFSIGGMEGGGVGREADWKGVDSHLPPRPLSNSSSSVFALHGSVSTSGAGLRGPLRKALSFAKSSSGGQLGLFDEAPSFSSDIGAGSLPTSAALQGDERGIARSCLPSGAASNRYAALLSSLASGDSRKK